MTVRIVKFETAKDSGIFIEIPYDFGDNIDEMTEKFGAAVTYNHALDNMVIALQSRGRAWYKGGKKTAGLSIEQVIEKGKAWKPEISNRNPANVLAKAVGNVAKLSIDQRKALLEVLRASMEQDVVEEENIPEEENIEIPAAEILPVKQELRKSRRNK